MCDVDVKRPETGAMQFGDDWCGVFIRGDNAYYYATALNKMLQVLTVDQKEYVLLVNTVKDMIELLKSCNHVDSVPHRMKDFDEAVKK